jgi:hypothetical protein
MDSNAQSSCGPGAVAVAEQAVLAAQLGHVGPGALGAAGRPLPGSRVVGWGNHPDLHPICMVSAGNLHRDVAVLVQRSGLLVGMGGRLRVLLGLCPVSAPAWPGLVVIPRGTMTEIINAVVHMPGLPLCRHLV